MKNDPKPWTRPAFLLASTTSALALVKLHLAAPMLEGAVAIVGFTVPVDIVSLLRAVAISGLWGWGRALGYFWRLAQESLRTPDPGWEGRSRTEIGISRVECLTAQRDCLALILVLTSFGLALTASTHPVEWLFPLFAFVGAADLVRLYDRRSVYDRFAHAALENLRALMPGRERHR